MTSSANLKFNAPRQVGVERPGAIDRGVLFLIRSLDFGGAQRQLCTLAIQLQALGWPVKVVTFYPGGALWTELESAGVPVLSLNKRGRWDLLLFFLRLRKLVVDQSPGIVQTYLSSANLVGAFLKP